MLNIQTVLKALSDETRLRILNLLYEQELCVCDIMETLQITQTKASRHLGYMKNAGLVNDRKQAQWVHYSLIKHKESEFIESLIQENLRNEDIFRFDLEHLSAWLKVKDNACVK